MDTLKDLIDMGFAPMMALIAVAVIVLWGTLCGVVVFVYRQFLKDRKERDELRETQLSEINARLASSEEKHDECDDDRARMHGEITKQHTEIKEMSERIGRFGSCPRKGCPMRLP